jgi:hypothetical protein
MMVFAWFKVLNGLRKLKLMKGYNMYNITRKCLHSESFSTFIDNPDESRLLKTIV